MKLHELGNQRQTEQIARVIESHSGSRIDFDRLSPSKAKSMLTRVRGLIKEHRSSPSFHYSEKNPDYTKLVMIEQALNARIAEVAPAMVPGMAAPSPQDAAKAQVVQRERKKQIQDAIKAAQEQIASLQKQMQSPTLGIAEGTRRKLRESELQSAQVVLAAQDMIDRIQKMLEQISEMQFKDLPALTDSIKNDMGTDQASQFQSDASAALTQLLTSVQAGKVQLEAAQGVLTGQAPVVPGQDEDFGELPAPVPGEEGDGADIDLGLDANLPDDEEEVSVASLGREKR